MQPNLGFPESPQQSQAFQALLGVFGSIEDLSSIYTAMKTLMQHDVTLRALLIIAFKNEISGRELARLMGISQSKIRRLFANWESSGLIEHDKGYKIKPDDLRAGLYKIAKQLDILAP
jgi:DNA-binding IclR family transcriptional regulator